MSVEKRIRCLQAASPFYAQQLRQHPDWIDWLEMPINRDFEYRYASLEDLWLHQFNGEQFSLSSLRQFRRRMSLRIAYREINGLSQVDESWRELSLLAKFVLSRLCKWRWAQWRDKLGVPFCEDTNEPARYCIFALGKLGSGELNFCSDLDLIFCIEGNGACRKNGRETSMSSREFYDRFFRQISEDLTSFTADGMLYNLDLRLRPEGSSGPLVRSASSLTHYYWDLGQTWERLAWLRASIAAGDEALGQSVLEEINPFRYPRFPPGNLINEVAGVKLRTENEVPVDELERDIKSGKGGIREIEFIIHALQLIHGGRNPFLQTNSTIKALEKLARYEVLPAEDVCYLDAAYRWLRKLENRLQMHGETSRHCLPGKTEERQWLSDAMGAPDWETFERELREWRRGVHERYVERFPTDPMETDIQAWTAFLAGQPPTVGIREQLASWFPESDDVVPRLRRFVLGDSLGLITRDSVLRFLELTTYFARVLPRLARPMQTLERIGVFAERYGARRHFFRNSNPALFESLGLLFDRSTFIYELLCRYPGVMEELLHEAPRRLKSRGECRAEIQHLREGEGDYADRLWLYVKAEQVRLATAELLYGVSLESICWALCQLAEAVLLETLEQLDLADLTVIALGRFGAEELSLGSDLDLLLISEKPVSDQCMVRIRQWRKLFTHNAGLGPMFVVDLRLRPHGEVGPLAVTIGGLAHYHTSGQAKCWEKQILVRARPVAGPAQTDFLLWRDALLYRRPLNTEEIREIWAMRLSIEQEKPALCPPAGRAFKTGPGGMLDLEFLAELLSLVHGADELELRQGHAHTCFLSAQTKGLISEDVAGKLTRNLSLLRNIEFNLRRQKLFPVEELPTDEIIEQTLVPWLGWANLEEFWRRYTELIDQNRQLALDWLEQALARKCPDPPISREPHSGEVI